MSISINIPLVFNMHFNKFQWKFINKNAFKKQILIKFNTIECLEMKRLVFRLLNYSK